MRYVIVLLGTTMLAACGGAGPNSAGGIAPGGSVDPATGQPHSFVAPTKTVEYGAIGGGQSYSYVRETGLTPTGPVEQTRRIYDSNSTESGDGAIKVTYNRDDAEFYLQYKDKNSTIDMESLFQDPAHRTAFGGAVEPDYGTPDLTSNGVFYVEGTDN